MNVRLWIGILTVTCGLVGCGVSNGSKTTGAATTVQKNVPTGTSVGDKAPAFQLTTLGTGKSVSLSSLLGHKYIMLNAWASWCPPCNQEAPQVAAVAKKYESKLQVVGINMTTTDTNLANVKAFVQKYHLTMPVALDKKATFADAYHIMALPTSFLLSPQGKILAVYQGPLPSGWVKQVIGA